MRKGDEDERGRRARQAASKSKIQQGSAACEIFMRERVREGEGKAAEQRGRRQRVRHRVECVCVCVWGKMGIILIRGLPAKSLYIRCLSSAASVTEGSFPYFRASIRHPTGKHLHENRERKGCEYIKPPSAV